MFFDSQSRYERVSEHVLKVDLQALLHLQGFPPAVIHLKLVQFILMRLQKLYLLGELDLQTGILKEKVADL